MFALFDEVQTPNVFNLLQQKMTKNTKSYL